MSQPSLSIARSDQSQQKENNDNASTYADVFKSLGFPSEYIREVKGSRPSFAIEEDLGILEHAGLNLSNLLIPSNNDSELVTWWMDFDNKDFLYEYHKIFIQMLTSVHAPQSYWLFKAPTHTLYLNFLFNYYPKASLIMIHRRLDQVIPSSIRLALSMTKIFLNTEEIDINSNRDAIIQPLLRRIDLFIRRLVEWRRDNQNIEVLDLSYEDLLAQPIDTVRRLYKHFGFAWSDQFEQSMIEWLQKNPQGSQGRNLYTLDEFGLERQAIEKTYKQYYDMFLKS